MHIWRFSPIQHRWIAARSRIEDAASGVLCHGLISGEGAETQGMLTLPRLACGMLILNLTALYDLPVSGLPVAASASEQQSIPRTRDWIGVSGNFKQLLNYSYNSALWTTIIDPKVTL